MMLTSATTQLRSTAELDEKTRTILGPAQATIGAEIRITDRALDTTRVDSKTYKTLNAYRDLLYRVSKNGQYER